VEKKAWKMIDKFLSTVWNTTYTAGVSAHFHFPGDDVVLLFKCRNKTY